MDDVIRAVDEQAYRLGTSRSNLINQILAEHLSCVTPEMRRHIFRTAGIHVLLLPAVVWFFVDGSLPLWLMGVTAAAELLYIVLAKYITREDIRVLSRN